MNWLEQSGELFWVPFSDTMTSVLEDFFYVGNSSVKRDFLLEAGPFDERFRYHACEDLELGLRLSNLGMKVSLLPEAKAEHVHDISQAERCQVMTQAGESAAALDRKYRGDHFRRRKCLVPPWCFSLYGRMALRLHALSRRDRYLISYYRARLNASFVAGHRHDKDLALRANTTSAG